MTEVVSVRFKNRGKRYYFDPRGHTIETGQNVIVETSKGLEFGECSRGNFHVEDDAVIPPLRPVIRPATAADISAAAANKEKERVAFTTCLERIRAHNLDMKLVDVEYNFEGSKILFFFTSDGRVDFRELVKDLAATFRTRIELRQIGVRDEAKMLGGLGICGKPFCCTQFLDEFQPVSIKMAKVQNLSLNPTKISGTCGRLMCCLKFEQAAYEALVKNAPKTDSYVETPDGNGTITEINLLRQIAKVRMDTRAGDPVVTYYPLDQLQFIKTGKQHRAELIALAKQRQESGGGGRDGGPGLQMRLEQSPKSPQKRDRPKRDGQKRDGPKRENPEQPLGAQTSGGQGAAPGAEGGEVKKRPRKRSRRRPGGKPDGGQTSPPSPGEHAPPAGPADGPDPK